MRILTFIFIFSLMTCGNTDSQKEESQQTATVQAETKNSTSSTEGTKSYKKTAKNSEFAIYRTISANETHTTYFFKTLDGISLNFDVLIGGEPGKVIPRNLLEDAKYSVGHPGANADMVGKVFELIYDKDNNVGEVKLAEEL